MKQQKKILRGEAALVLAVIINSLGVLLMLQSGSGISAISSVPYAFQQVFPKLTLGTWTYLFQGLLICILMIMRKKFVPSYLFSFVVGFAFGEMMDLHELWITRLPLNIPLRRKNGVSTGGKGAGIYSALLSVPQSYQTFRKIICQLCKG